MNDNSSSDVKKKVTFREILGMFIILRAAFDDVSKKV